MRRISGISTPAKIRMLAAVLTLLPPAGCVSVGPDFEPPDPLLPSVPFFSKSGPLVPNRAPAASAKGDVSPVDPAWWTAFRDPILTSLARRVAAANLDVNSATLKLAESRSQLGVVASAALPAINGNASYQRELFSQNGLVSLGNQFAPPGTSFVVPPSAFTKRGSTPLGNSTSGATSGARSRPPVRRPKPPKLIAVACLSPPWPNSPAITFSCGGCRPRSRFQTRISIAPTTSCS